MDSGRPSLSSQGDSQDSDDLVPPGTTGTEHDTSSITVPKKVKMSKKGIENAKKRLRAFSIQKKTPIAPISVPKPVNTGSTTVLIGKLASVRTTPKPDVEPDKKPPKPPKPGASKRNFQDSYTELQKRTLSEIEDMKRKMELVELGIPLGLICPSPTSEKAMPTKAMPPIKTFLDESKVDELIREAKKAKAAGKEFKFDYQKLLPDYDNPFQRKKDELEKEKVEEERGPSRSKPDRDRKESEPSYKSRKSDKYERRYSDHRKDDRDKKDKYKDDKYKDRSKDRDKVKEKKEKDKEKEKEKEREVKKDGKDPKETDVNLNDYLVCDTWSLDNDDRTNSSPKVDPAKISQWKARQAADLIKETLKSQDSASESPSSKPVKIEKLQPVMDSFEFEIDPNEDEALDMFDKDIELEKFAKPTIVKDDPFDSPVDLKLFDYDQDLTKEGVIDANDDNFLESVINEIKQENMSDDTSQDKGLVEYDISPKDDYDDNSKNDASLGSVTPELDDRMRDLQSSQHSHYSDGYRSTESYKSTESGYKSTESGYKSTESGYKSTESSYKSAESGYKSAESGYKSADTSYKTNDSYKSKDRSRSSSRQADNYRMSVEKELDEAMGSNTMSKSTVDSLETWSFVLKICQPLLFRHDRNKCYKETHVLPKIWFAENPKGCSCVKDRSVVYEELEMCKMGLVDRVYGCDQIPDEPPLVARAWYPRSAGAGAAPARCSDWEDDERPPGSLTPQHTEEIYLDREYQRFMEAVWPDVAEPPADTSRSTTPIRQDTRKKKKQPEEPEKDAEDKKKAKKIKLSSEGWSQESDVEEDNEKPGKKLKQEKDKSRKRKHSTSTETTLSDSDDDKKKKLKKKGGKKLKAKLAKKRRLDKKLKRRLKQKQKKKKRLPKVEVLSDDSGDEKDKKKEKKIKKKKQLKLKKIQKKKKVKVQSSSSSSLSSSSSDTESDVEKKKKMKKKELAAKKKKKDKKKKRKQSSDSTQSEELFDVNVLKNIKTERMSDDEFSPRRQKPREIINVKELQNDFVGNNIHIKQEKVDSPKEIASPPLVDKKEESCEMVQTPVEAVVETKQEEIEPVKPPTPELVQEIALPKMLEESHSIPLPEESITPTNLDEIALPCDDNKSTDTIKASQHFYDVRASQADVYQKQGEVYQKHGETYQKQSDIYEKQGDIYHKQGDIYHKQGDTYNKQDDNYQKQEQLYQKQCDSYQKQDELYQKQVTNQKQDDTYQKQEEIYQKPVDDYNKQDNLYHKQGSVYQKQGDTYQKQTDIYQKQGDIYHKQGDTYQKQDDLYQKQGDMYQKELEGEGEDKFADSYEMLEQMAMAYQSDVANQHLSGTVPPDPALDSPQSQRIETLVRRRGEIKCDWRAGDSPTPSHNQRPSRWGLKPGEVNIVLTGGAPRDPVSPADAQYPIRSVLERAPYSPRACAGRHDNQPSGYDEAYMDMFGPADRMAYGDCFAAEPPQPEARLSTLDERINRALRQTTLGEVTKETDDVEMETDKDTPEKGILVTKSLCVEAGRGAKRVSFADGYKPGQDSDVEEPPVKKRKKARRRGCAWPCPASHPDHVPLWDALPPPPPPASPPPPPQAAPPLHLLRRVQPPHHAMLQPPMHGLKLDPSASLPPFMPPEPPPGLINFP